MHILAVHQNTGIYAFVVSLGRLLRLIHIGGFWPSCVYGERLSDCTKLW